MELGVKQQKRVQMIVVGAVTVMFVLIIVLAFQIAQRTSHANQLRSLAAEREALQNQINQAERDIGHFNSCRFVDEYAWQQLGWGRPGSTHFRR